MEQIQKGINSILETNFIVAGIFVLLMTTIVRYVLSSPPKVFSPYILRDVFKLKLNYNSERFIPSFFQLVGLVWIILGIVLQFIRIENKYLYIVVFLSILSFPLWGLVLFSKFKRNNK